MRPPPEFTPPEDLLYMVGEQEPVEEPIDHTDTLEKVAIATVIDGTAMFDTGCTRSIAGKISHGKIQERLDKLGIKYT